MGARLKPLSMAVADPALIAGVVAERTSVKLDPRPKSDYVENLRRMSRTAEFDLCEMPLVSVLQGVAVGLRVRVLPVVMLRRTPHLYWVGPDTFKPKDLNAVTTGVRSYAQTTGVWLRAVLSEQYGIGPGNWVTTDEERYSELPAPRNVRRVRDADGVEGLLRKGIVQAIVAPSSNTPSLMPLLDNVAQMARLWATSHAISPVNHVLICSEAAARHRLDELLSVCAALRDFALNGSAGAVWAAGDDVVASRRVDECFDREQIVRSAGYLASRAVAQGVLPGRINLTRFFA